MTREQYLAWLNADFWVAYRANPASAINEAAQLAGQLQVADRKILALTFRNCASHASFAGFLSMLGHGTLQILALGLLLVGWVFEPNYAFVGLLLGVCVVVFERTQNAWRERAYQQLAQAMEFVEPQAPVSAANG